MRNAWVQPLAQDRQGRQYVDGTQRPPHYAPQSDQLAKVMLRALEELVTMPADWTGRLTSDQAFCRDNCPSPEPILRNQPKF
ncbi:MAG TPA: hypothetical protein VG498_21325 [Terriglobales bacterium]|nr:hypothetical protein [Terriglobales bacterium]